MLDHQEATTKTGKRVKAHHTRRRGFQWDRGAVVYWTDRKGRTGEEPFDVKVAWGQHQRFTVVT